MLIRSCLVASEDNCLIHSSEFYSRSLGYVLGLIGTAAFAFATGSVDLPCPGGDLLLYSTTSLRPLNIFPCSARPRAASAGVENLTKAVSSLLFNLTITFPYFSKSLRMSSSLALLDSY